MRRGFKSQAEKLSLQLRAEAGLTPRARLDAKEFLKSLGYIIWTPAEVPGIDLDDVAQLTQRDPDSWSGVTVRDGDTIAIIVNPTHPPTRQANTLMHEWSHIELRHKPNRVDRSKKGLLLLSDYPAEFEEEANWLSAAVLLPRDGLLYHRARGLSSAEIAEHYAVSKQLANWRLRMTGVEKQLRSRF